MATKHEMVRGAAIGFSLAAGVAIVAIPVLVWGSDHSPEFFGAFAAAIVAAIAVVLGAYYQTSLDRQRDDEARRREQIATATDLYFWLEHAALEMEFIADVLLGVGQHLAQDQTTNLDWPVDTYREVVQSHFMSELLERAKSAASLPKDFAGTVTQSLYRSFSVVDRIHRLRGVPDTFRATADHVAKHEQIARREAERLRAVHVLLGEFLSLDRDTLSSSINHI